MSRRYYRQYSGYQGPHSAAIGMLVLFCGLVFVVTAATSGFGKAMLNTGTFLVLFFGTIYVIKYLARLHKRHRVTALREKLKANNVEEEVINFINRFGLIKDGDATGFSYRNYSFEQHRIDDLLAYLRDHGVKTDHKRLYGLLRLLIDEKERALTFDSVQKAPKRFSDISPAEFEHLIGRLFESMGYAVQITGKTGDQGADVVASKDGTRVLVQAKRYNTWKTGNDAVQQAVAAMKLYDCTNAMVVTTSDFTSEAIELAKANNVQLLEKRELQEALLKHLQESWL